MASPIGTTIEILCRHHMIIHATCLRCGREGEFAATGIRTDRNRNEDFRSLVYRCTCGSRRTRVYAFPPDMRDGK